MPAILLTLSPDILPVIDERSESTARGVSRGATISRDLGRAYYALAAARAELRDQFSGDELSAIADSLNGSIFDDWSINHIQSEIEDAVNLNGCALKWGIDGPLLVRKLSDLSYTQKWAIVDSVERFWRRVKAGADLLPADLLR